MVYLTILSNILCADDLTKGLRALQYYNEDATGDKSSDMRSTCTSRDCSVPIVEVAATCLWNQLSSRSIPMTLRGNQTDCLTPFEGFMRLTSLHRSQDQGAG